jgi:hypothetical protein
MADASESVELIVKVSDKDGIKQIGFAYDADSSTPKNPVEPVFMRGGLGRFRAQHGVEGRLIWGMRGEGGGKMKVELFRGDQSIEVRDASTIPADKDRAVDFFDVLV